MQRIGRVSPEYGNNADGKSPLDGIIVDVVVSLAQVEGVLQLVTPYYLLRYGVDIGQY